MPVSGVIQRKFALLDRHMLQLSARLASVDLATFQGDWGLQLMTERSLQVMAEIVIDVCERVIAVKGAGPAATASEAITKLQELGVIASAPDYAPIVRFRDLIVHQYQDIDPAIVFDIATNHIGLFRRFRDEIDRS